MLIIGNVLLRSRLPPKRGCSVWPDITIFKSLPFALTTAAVFFIEWGLFIPINYLTSYALAQGFSTAFSYDVISVFFAGSFFGRLVPGYVADKIGRFNTLILTVTLCLITTLALWLPAAQTTTLLLVYSVLFGFASGSNISLTPVCVGQLCTTEDYGRYYATCYTIVSFGYASFPPTFVNKLKLMMHSARCLTGIPIAGQILSSNNGEYWGLVVFTGLCYAGGLMFTVAARVLQVGWKPTVIY